MWHVLLNDVLTFLWLGFPKKKLFKATKTGTTFKGLGGV